MDKCLPSRRLLPSLAVALLLAVAGCGGDDDGTSANSDGGAPTSTGVATVPASDDPWAAAIGEGLAEYNVADAREEGDTIVFVMEEGSTEDDVTRICEAAADSERPVSTEVDGTVTPCP